MPQRDILPLKWSESFWKQASNTNFGDSLPVPYFAWWDPRISTEHLHRKAVQFSEDEQALRNQTGVNRRNLLKGAREDLGYRDVDRCYLQPKEEFRLANQVKLAAQSAALGQDNRKVKLDHPTDSLPFPR